MSFIIIAATLSVSPLSSTHWCVPPLLSGYCKQKALRNTPQIIIYVFQQSQFCTQWISIIRLQFWVFCNKNLLYQRKNRFILFNIYSNLFCARKFTRDPNFILHVSELPSRSRVGTLNDLLKRKKERIKEIRNFLKNPQRRKERKFFRAFSN